MEKRSDHAKTWISLNTAILVLSVSFAMSAMAIGQGSPAMAADSSGTKQASAGIAPEPETLDFNVIQLPPSNTLEYWVIRNQALHELVPFLTKKRAEIKDKRQILADYLMQIGKADDFAAQNIEVPDDPKLYAQAFGVLQGLEQENIDVSQIQVKKHPDWDGLVEFAMKHALYEGYLPAKVEGDEEFQMYKEVVIKNEKYGRKVFSELRPIADQCIKMWLYLGTIHEQSNLKTHVAEMKLKAKEAKDAMREKIVQEKRQTAYEHAQEKEEKRFQQSLDRSQQQRHDQRVDFRQSDIEFRQSRLDDRYTNNYHY